MPLVVPYSYFSVSLDASDSSLILSLLLLIIEPSLFLINYNELGISFLELPNLLDMRTLIVTDFLNAWWTKTVTNFVDLILPYHKYNVLIKSNICGFK